MKTTFTFQRLPLVAALSLMIIAPATVRGQGQLLPPGATYSYANERALDSSGNPTPSMKTLMQIDAGEHIPSRSVSNTNLNGTLGHYHLTQPGRYYLTENLDKHIVISSDNVTLDLGGFEIRYTGSGTGPIAIGSSGLTGSYIRTKVINGRIRGDWSQGAILGNDSVVSGVDVSDATSYGIKVGKNSQVADSRVRGKWVPGNPGVPGSHSGIYGEDATVISQCSASDINGIGIQVNQNGRVVDSTVQNVQGCGIVTNHHSTVGGCAVRLCGSTGFDLGMGSTLHNSAASECGDPGVHVRNGCTVANVTSRDNKDHGFISESWTVMEPTYNKNATNFIQCSAQGNDGHGFFVTHSCAFTDCTADDNGSAPIGGLSTGDGFHTSDNCRLSNCVASNNQHSGIYGENGNTVDGCSATGNQQYGIEMLSDSNTVIRNTLRDNTLAPIQPTPGTNGLAPLQAPATATHPFANFGL